MPQRVDRLILVDADGYEPSTIKSGQKVPLAFQVAQIPGVRVLASYTLPRGLVEQSLRELYGEPNRVTPELVDMYSDIARREGNRQALARRLQQGYGTDLALLKEIKAPTLVLWGGKDRLLPPELGERFARDIPGARLVLFPELGHMPQEEDPQRSLAEVRRFLGI
jgi:pimeloyl-ACP methyl ester carboxylesterase